MNKKELLELGIEDEDVQKKVIILHGKGIEKLKGEVKTLTDDKSALNVQLEEAGETIDSFKDMDIEGVKKSAEDWKEKAEVADKAKKEAEETKTAEVAKLKFDHALDKELTGAKAKDVKSVRAHLKLEELKMDDDGKITGLEAQLETVSEKHDYLFDSESEDPKDPVIVTGTKGKSVLGDSAVEAARVAAGLKPEKG